MLLFVDRKNRHEKLKARLLLHNYSCSRLDIENKRQLLASSSSVECW